MKKLLSALSLVLALLMMVTACQGPALPADTTEGGVTEAPTDPTTSTDVSTETPTEPSKSDTEPEEEPATPALGDQIDLIAHTLTAGDGKITLAMTAEVKEAGLTGTVKLTLSDKDGAISDVSFAADGEHTAVLECPADRLNGELAIVGNVTSPDGEVLDEMTLLMKNGLPRLTPDGVRCVVAAMTPEEKAHMVTGVQKPVKPGASGGTYPIDRLGVPSITVNDGPAGVRYNTSIWYPSVHNLTASWDPALISKVGQAIGEDSLALGIDIVLGPGMNIQKNVLCGRNFEYCSEDPILTGIMSTAYVRGMQSTGAGACLKHYAANNQ
jgi:hypothetical protein